MLWRFRLAIWPVLLLTFVGAGLPRPWGWMAGSVFGAFWTLWLVTRDAVPRHIEQWLDGAEGEKRTEKRLRSLEARGWVVAHDLEAKYGNIDHFVVGPSGVFLLDSKNWGGTVTLEDGIVMVTPRDNPDAAWSPRGLSRALKAASAGNNEAIQRLTGVREWVQPVVVVWAPFEARCVLAEGIRYVAGDALVEWLTAQPARLDPATVERVGRLFAV